MHGAVQQSNNQDHQCLHEIGPLPTRALDVTGKRDTIKLWEPRGMTGDYIAAQKQGISPSQLPATFRHAVQIARALNIPYV
jgi:hypothetical protein